MSYFSDMKKDYSINYLLVVICLVLAVFVIVNAKLSAHISAEQNRIDNIQK